MYIIESWSMQEVWRAQKKHNRVPWGSPKIGATLASWMLPKLPKCIMTRWCTAKAWIKQLLLFHNITHGNAVTKLICSLLGYELALFFTFPNLKQGTISSSNNNAISCWVNVLRQCFNLSFIFCLWTNKQHQPLLMQGSKTFGCLDTISYVLF